MLRGEHNLDSYFVQRVWEHAAPRKNNRALHQVLQLADVARPGIPLKGGHGIRRNVVDLLSHAVAELRTKCVTRAAISARASITGPLARLQLGRAEKLMGDDASVRESYEESLNIWKDADPDLPVYRQAKASTPS
jgi:hypothetical protein